MAPMRLSEGGAHGQEGLALLVEGGAILTRWGPMRGSIASPSGVRRSRVSLIGASFSWEGSRARLNREPLPNDAVALLVQSRGHSTREPTVLCFMTLHPHVNRWRFMRKGFSFNVDRRRILRKGFPFNVDRAPVMRKGHLLLTSIAESVARKGFRFNGKRELVMRKGPPLLSDRALP